MVTVGAIVWAMTRTPIYEVKSNVQIGFIGENLIAEPSTLIKIVNKVKYSNNNDNVRLF